MAARILAVAAALSATLAAGCGGGDSGEGDGVLTPGGPPATPTLNVERSFPNVPDFVNPVDLLQAPGDNTRWFVVEQAGRVMVFENSPTATTKGEFIDIRTRVASGGEMGLLGMAFHPSFPADPRVFLYYTNTTTGRVSRLSAFTTANGGATLDPNSERILMTINQPEDNHNGGGLGFSSDGLLLLGLGDGGGGNDQHGTIGNAQSLTTVLGKMIRIDIGTAAGATYTIPTDNPYAGNPLCNNGGASTQSCPEIYAYGLRNPWRWSFDRQTGELWVADVGQGQLEEVNKVTRGGNYGWRCFEGSSNTGLGCGSPQNPLPPIAQYGRTLGRSITGGFVYRGAAYSNLVGRYVFGDFLSGRIWSIPVATTPTLTVTDGFESGLGISSFAQANNGEIYVLHYSAGRIYRLIAS